MGPARRRGRRRRGSHRSGAARTRGRDRPASEGHSAARGALLEHRVRGRAALGHDVLRGRILRRARGHGAREVRAVGVVRGRLTTCATVPRDRGRGGAARRPLDARPRLGRHRRNDRVGRLDSLGAARERLGGDGRWQAPRGCGNGAGGVVESGPGPLLRGLRCRPHGSATLAAHGAAVAPPLRHGRRSGPQVVQRPRARQDRRGRSGGVPALQGPDDGQVGGRSSGGS